MRITDTFYGAYSLVLQEATDHVLTYATRIKGERKCIEHITTRLKTPESVEKKLLKQGFSPTLQEAQHRLHDLVGIRLVCRFVSDIYTVSQLLQEAYQVTAMKDYIANPKPNGYRSYHMILRVPTASGAVVSVEIQLRTISQDSWACLEHQMKYKKSIHNEKLVRDELKRCADELAATDLCMQTIREFIDMDGIPHWDG